MAQTAADFLAQWRQSYIYAEARSPEALNATVDEIVDDAAREGLTRADLDKAAGGDLRIYILAAIAKAGGE